MSEVKVDYERKTKDCPECGGKPNQEDLELVNYDMMWHDGDVICEKCNRFHRHWDAG